MRGLFSLITDIVVAAFGVDAAALRTEMRDCYNGIQRALTVIIVGLVVCYGLAWTLNNFNVPHAEWLHAAYAVIAIGSLTMIYRHIMVGYALIGANKKFVEMVLNKAADILIAGGEGAEAVAAAIANAQEKFKAVIKQTDGEWSDMLLTALTELLTPLKLGNAGVASLQKSLAKDLQEFSAALKDIRANTWAMLKKEALPISQFFIGLVMGVILFSLINTVWPWWTNPPAYLLAVLAGIMALLAWINGIKQESEAKAELPKEMPTWQKRVIYTGLIGLGGLVLGYMGADGFYGEKITRLFQCLAAGSILAMAIYYGHHIGWQKSSATLLSIVSVSAIAWANWHEPVPDYVGTWHAGGIPKYDMVEVKNPTVAVSNTFWSRRGKYRFVPRRDASGKVEMIDNGRTLKCLDSWAKKDVTGELWILVVEVDNEGFAKDDEEPYHVPWRLDYVHPVPGPGVPVEMIRSSAAAEMAKPARVDFSAALAFHAFAKEKFAPAWQRVTWHGFPPATEKFFDPLASFKIKRRFSDPMPKGDYSGVDMVCDFSADEIPVYAAANGVVDATTLTHRSVTIKHQDGVWLYYGNLNTIAAGIKAGVKVKRGQIIGSIANGSPDGAYHGQPALFLTAIREDENDNTIVPVDPLPLLGRAPYPTLASEEDSAGEEE